MIGRKNLMLERAKTILLLYYQLVQATDPDTADATTLVEEMQAPTAPHANCARSFARLFRSDRDRATEVAERIRGFLGGRSL